MNNGSILTFLSEQGDKERKTNEYYDEKGDKYSGTWTNDAPCCYLLKKAFDEKTPIKEIIYIASATVQNEPDTISDFINCIKNYAYENGMDNEIEFKLISYNENNDEHLSKLGDLYEQLKKSISTNNMYVDFTGGLRDVTFYMVSVIKYLKLNNINCRSISYSDNNQKKIFSIDYISDFFDIVSGVDEFTSTAYTTTLQNLLNTKKIKDDDFRVILKHITDFTNDLTVGKVDDVDEEINEIANALNAYEKLQEETIYTVVFKSLIPAIKEGMHLNKILNNTEINYPELISWCIEHDMVQQAMALYVEKIPGYYIRNDEEIGREVKKIYKENKHTELNIHNSNMCADALYTVYMNRYIPDTTIREFKKEFRKVFNTTLDNMGPISKLCNFIRLKKDSEYYDGYKRLAKILESGSVSYAGSSIGFDDIFSCTDFFFPGVHGATKKYWRIYHYLVYCDARGYRNFEKDESKQIKIDDYRKFHDDLENFGIVDEYKRVLETYIDAFISNANGNRYSAALERTGNLMKKTCDTQFGNLEMSSIAFYDRQLSTVNCLRNIDAFLNQLWGDNISINERWLYHYLTKNDINEYQYMNMSGREYSTNKKINFLKSIKGKVSNDFYEKMIFYIFVKYYRNSVAHGYPSITGLPEEYVLEIQQFMKEYHIDIDLFDYDFDSLKSFMKTSSEVARIQERKMH